MLLFFVLFIFFCSLLFCYPVLTLVIHLIRDFCVCNCFPLCLSNSFTLLYFFYSVVALYVLLHHFNKLPAPFSWLLLRLCRPIVTLKQKRTNIYCYWNHWDSFSFFFRNSNENANGILFLFATLILVQLFVTKQKQIATVCPYGSSYTAIRDGDCTHPARCMKIVWVKTEDAMLKHFKKSTSAEVEEEFPNNNNGA